jgi:hypothetical protein
MYSLIVILHKRLDISRRFGVGPKLLLKFQLIFRPNLMIANFLSQSIDNIGKLLFNLIKFHIPLIDIFILFLYNLIHFTILPAYTLDSLLD